MRKGFICKTFDIDRGKWLEIIRYTIAEKDAIREIPSVNRFYSNRRYPSQSYIIITA
jgi:hypothetical protein